MTCALATLMLLGALAFVVYVIAAPVRHAWKRPMATRIRRM